MLAYNSVFSVAVVDTVVKVSYRGIIGLLVPEMSSLWQGRPGSRRLAQESGVGRGIGPHSSSKLYQLITP